MRLRERLRLEMPLRRPRGAPIVSLSIGLLVVVLLAACSWLIPSVADDDGEVRIHARNLSERTLGYTVDSRGSSGWGLLELSSGCRAVRLPWTISVGPAGPDGALGEYTQILTSADFDGALSVELWIEVSADGQLATGRGQPAWSFQDAAHCGPFR